MIRMKIVTIRNDGCFVEAEMRSDGKLNICLKSHFPKCFDEVVTSDIINPEDMFQWINNHQDY